jgi:hypothetical protein
LKKKEEGISLALLFTLFAAFPSNETRKKEQQQQQQRGRSAPFSLSLSARILNRGFF